METIKSATKENIVQLYKPYVEMLTPDSFTVVSFTVDNHKSNQPFIKKLVGDDLPTELLGGAHVSFNSANAFNSLSRNSSVIHLIRCSIMLISLYKVN